MSYTYSQRRRPPGRTEPAAEHAAPGPDLSALISGSAQPDAALKGRPLDLDGAIKAKMENAFGDLSGVKLYESSAVGEAGAEAVAQGNEIAFAPGMADFSSRDGQERLGHELSHVMLQRSGAVRGKGFLNDPALESRADREGAMAAAGAQVYTGPVTAALSGAAPSAAVAGPMQAKRRDADAKQVKEMKSGGENYNGAYATPDYAGYGDLNPEEWEEKTHRPGLSKLWGKKNQTYKVRRGTDEEKQGFMRKAKASSNVDRLYRIRAARAAGKAGESLVSQEDSDWFDHMRENADLDTFQELYDRYAQASKDLVQYRDAVQDPDPLKRNYEAAWSDPGLDVDIYNTLATELAESPGAEQFGMLQQEKDMQRIQAGEDWSEESKIQQEAGRIRDANSPDVHSDRSYLFGNEGAMEDYERRLPLRDQRYLELALAKDRKKQGGGKAKPQNIINEAPPLIQDEEPALEDNFLKKDLIDDGPDLPDDLIKDEAPQDHAADLALLNSQTGSAEERKTAYNNLAIPTAKNMTADQRHAVSEYIAGSSGPNAYLREQKSNPYYPQGEEAIRRTQKEVSDISEAIQSNPLPQQLTTYRGTTDKFFAMLLQQNGLDKAVNGDGSVNHKWLNKNQKKLQKALVGKVFRDKAFTSTSTEKSFAQFWSRESAKNEKMLDLGMQERDQEAQEFQQMAFEHPEQIPGAHLLTVNLPKGAKGAFVDRTTDGTAKDGVDQREVLLDKGSAFRISGIRKMADSDSYELMMDLLAEEEGKKKGDSGDPLNDAVMYGKKKKKKKRK